MGAQGGELTFNIASYKYHLNGHSYKGKGAMSLTRNRIDRRSDLKIRYLPIAPSFSFSFIGLFIYASAFLGFLGLGVLQTEHFIKKHTKSQHPR